VRALQIDPASRAERITIHRAAGRAREAPTRGAGSIAMVGLPLLQAAAQDLRAIEEGLRVVRRGSRRLLQGLSLRCIVLGPIVIVELAVQLLQLFVHIRVGPAGTFAFSLEAELYCQGFVTFAK